MSKHLTGKAGSWRTLAPNATVFVASAAIMTLELVAGRLIAAYLGMSLYTWTTIIGVMMGGMALGNYLGGRLADRARLWPALGAVFLAAALGTLTLIPVNHLLGHWPVFWRILWPARICLHVALTFLGPAVLLGMITPLVAQLALQLRPEAGKAVGGVFAAGVLGSLAGTFFTGYYLLMVQGVSVIVVETAVVLGLLGTICLAVSRGARGRAGAPVRLQPERHGQERPPSPEDTHRWPPRKMLGPGATVFLSNAAFMMLELAASRALSREFGASLYTWTTVIGVVLAGISLGNYVGGRVADHLVSRRAVAAVLLLSSVTTLLAPSCAQGVLNLFSQYFTLTTLSWPVQIALFMSGAFFLPNLFMGMVSPIVAKRCLDRGVSSGRAVGDVYAWGAVGAIAGTFLAGYFLIDFLGALPLLGVTALLLAGAAAVYAPRAPFTLVWLALSILINASAFVPQRAAATAAEWAGLRSAADPRIVYEDESQYSYIAVLKEVNAPQVRDLMLDRLAHSKVDLNDPTALKYEYEWIYEAVVDKFYPDSMPLDAMVIGGGGYTFPHYLELVRPGSYVEVSEIDPAVTAAAHAAFGLPRDTGVHIYHMDARNRVADLMEREKTGEAVRQFDCVFGDSINDYTVPFHLTTLEFTQQVHALLKEDGIYMLNMIDLFNSGGFLAGVVNTCRQVFPFVYVFNTGRQTAVRDTFVVLSSKRPLNVQDVVGRIQRKHVEYTGLMLEPAVLDGLVARHHALVLTDDYAPVENLLRPVVKSREIDPGELLYLRAKAFSSQGKLKEAIEQAAASLEYHPRWPEVHAFLADLLTRRGDTEGAIEHWRAAIADTQRPALPRYQLGVLLLNLGRTEEALAEFIEATETEPAYWDAQLQSAKLATALGRMELAVKYWGNVVALAPDDMSSRYNLGLAYAGNRQYEAAVTEWERVLQATPGDPDTLRNLVLTYTGLGKYDEAWKYVHRSRELQLEVDPAVLESLRVKSGRHE